MGHYKSNLRDLQFNLFEFLNLPQGLTGSNYEGLTKADIEQILIEVDKFATGPLAEFFAETDRNPPTYDPQTFSVHIPTPFKQTIKQVLETGWHTVGIPSELAGIPAPRAIVWSVAEMFLGAQPAAYIYMAGAPFSRIFYDNGTAEQKEWAKIIAQRKWAATMVMTEPAAGSDVGASTTKAVQQPDGSWHLTGVKRFITSGDVDDMFENIFHLVLARPGGAPAGTKGLSLFFVPKWLFDFDTQTRGERNGVFATNLEHKMGLKASATCELTFGLQGIPAKGWLVGEVHQGIAQMFKLIEYARMTVGTKAIATLSTGYLNALEFAKQRVQGSDIVKFGDKSAPKVTIIHHPDIRRSLMMQKVYAEGLRALYLYTSLYQDEDVAKALFGVDADLARRVNDLLLPVVKGAGSEQAYEKLTESLQCLGGSGFLQDYPLEQYIRDAKIDSLYEGTTAIQAQDFIFRKIFKDQSVALTYIFQQITVFINEQPTDSHLYPAVENLQTALTNFQNIMVTLTEYLSNTATDTRMLQKIGLVSVRVLLAFGDLMIGWLLLAQAQVAAEKLAGGESLLAADKTFYEGKIMGARFFSQNVLPLLDSLQSIVSKIDTDIMELDESAF